MFSLRKVYLLAALLIATTVSAAEYVPGEVIVKFKDNSNQTRITMNSLYTGAGVKEVRRLTGIMRGYQHLILKDGVRVQDAIAELMRNDSVEYAQPNYILHILQQTPPPPGGGGGALPCIPGFDIPGCDPNAKLPCLIPGVFPPGCDGSGGGTPPGGGGGTDPTPAPRPPVNAVPADPSPEVVNPDLSQTWGLTKIHAPEAWAIHRGSKDFVVAVIDTGIDYNHENLALNVWRNPNPTNNDLVGFDFVHNDGLPFDDHMHGTHTSGTIGAAPMTDKMISGVSPHVKIMALKFLTAEGSGTTADAVKAIDYAIDHGAKVLSNSWGGPGDDGNQALSDAIDRAKAKDVLFVAAAGNDGVDNDTDPKKSYPAAFTNDNLISVAATDENDALAFFSNTGAKTVHVAAPGVNVYSTAPGNKYASESGTSMACPHVAGAAALVWSKNPTWTYKQVKDALMKSVDPIPGLAGKTVTGGRINVLNALKGVAGTTPVEPGKKPPVRRRHPKHPSTDDYSQS